MTTIQVGYIYKIYTPLDNSFCYIGSTFKKLKDRFQDHKDKYKNNYGDYSIHKKFHEFGFHNFKIILIKSYDCVRTDETDFKMLHSLETLWINKTKNCVNINIPFNPIRYSKEIKAQRDKEYYEKNKDKIKEYQKNYDKKNKDKVKDYQKEYREKNKEKLSELQKEYNEKNKEKLAEQKKEYNKKNKEKLAEQNKKWREKNKQKIKQKYEENKTEINKKRLVKVTCSCGCQIAKSSLAKHLKTARHAKLILEIQNQLQQQKLILTQN